MEPFERRKKQKPWAVLFFIGMGISVLIIPKDDNFINYVAYASILFGVIGALIPAKETRAEREARERKANYYNALKGTDKAEALRFGRIYYGGLREDGNVTTYDEQAIANDLNTMINTVNVVNTVIPKVEGGDLKLNSLIANQNRLYCSNCGNAYLPSEDKKFCEMCGNRL